jgi:O-antigen/teichoic acid export membrane protein
LKTNNQTVYPNLVAKNASILLLTDITSKILQVGLSVVIARKLGASDLGLLRYAIAFVTMLSFIPDAGLGTYINREASRYPEKSGIFFINFVFAKAIFSILTFLIILSSLYFQGKEYDWSIIILAGLIMLLDSFIRFYTAFFRGFQKAEYEARILISENLLMALTGIIIISLGFGLVFMMKIRLFVVLLVFIIGLLILKKKILQPPFKFSITLCLNLLKSAIPFTILLILIKINANIGIVLLTNIKGTVSTGWYSAALSLTGIFQFIPTSVGGAILPAMTKFAKFGDINNLELTLSRSIKYIMILVVPIAVGTTILADKIILLVFGETFTPAIITLKILIWLVILSFSNSIFNVAFSAIDKEKRFVKIQFAATVINILLCITLIPLLGHNGVALSITSSQLIVFITSMIYISKYYNNVKILSIMQKPAIAAFIMLICLLLFQSLPLLLILVISVGVYIVSLFFINVFDSDELNMIKTYLIKLPNKFFNRSGSN